MSTIVSSSTARPALRRIRDGYWRVTAPSGVVLGYVEEIDQEASRRYRAKRLVASTRVVEVGDFSEVAEAIECLR
ncbi:hypothetical protein [Herbiconiux liukaitaii]|uniref:hypothetical protein n=1 Tax=Herbiconiux liukaitaii TaxID=3342799 RepID=UPI0035BB5141